MKRFSLIIITIFILSGLFIIVLFSISIFNQIEKINKTINQGTNLVASQRQLKYAINEILYGTYLGIPIQTWDSSFTSFKQDFEDFMESDTVKKIVSGNEDLQITYETAWNHWKKLEDINQQAHSLLVEYMKSESYDNIGIYLQYIIRQDGKLSPLIKLLKSENSYLQLGFENILFSLIGSLKTESEQMSTRYIFLTGIFSFSFFLIIILGLTLYIIHMRGLNQQLDRMVKIRTGELDQKNREITESIICASGIQQSILVDNTHLQHYLKDFFILWNPRDIVSGDFYWFYGIDDTYLLALIDCMGHGIPGALTTMTVNSIIQRVVKDFINNDPARILDMLSVMFNETLYQRDELSRLSSGLDISLLYCNPRQDALVFAGARHVLFYVQDGTVNSIKGDKKSIGPGTGDNNFTYTNHTLRLNALEAVYLTSDGILNQRGGEKGFPFGKRNFIQFISQHYHEEMSAQKKQMQQEFMDYIKAGGFTLMDDITVIGFRL